MLLKNMTSRNLPSVCQNIIEHKATQITVAIDVMTTVEMNTGP